MNPRSYYKGLSKTGHNKLRLGCNTQSRNSWPRFASFVIQALLANKFVFIEFWFMTPTVLVGRRLHETLPRHFNAHPSWKIKRLINHQTAKEVDLWVSWVNELWITLLTHQATIFVHFCRFSDTKATQSCSHFIPSSELLSCIHNVCWKHFFVN